MLRVLARINGRYVTSKGMTSKIELSQVPHRNSPFFKYIGEEFIGFHMAGRIVSRSATGTHSYDINANSMKVLHEKTK